MIQFEKVSFEQYKKDFVNNVKDQYDIDEEKLFHIWNNIKLPKRATSGSAGYDFYLPHNACFGDYGSVIPTGIRCKMDGDFVLSIFPRSGLGFKYNMSLYNTVGIIDSDYYGSSNEGHIMIKVHSAIPFSLKAAEAFAQGVFMTYLKTDGDYTTSVRDGGFGSTSAGV